MRKALVTGGTRGIGAAIATELERQGICVMRKGREVTPLDAHGMDIIVCAGGYAEHRDAPTRDEWLAMYECHVVLPAMLIDRALPHMLTKGWGRILLISSTAGQHGGILQKHYASAKGGVEALTKSIAKTHGPFGVVCNCIAPGLIDTDMTRDEIARPETWAVVNSWPIPRVGLPRDVAPLAALLCSDAAAYITGQVVAVDGGRGI